jgi:single-stranded-DNA-specific exonuclease
VASRVVERFHRPAFVISEDEETGVAQGSGRSIPVFHLLDSLESMTDIFNKFGGHRQAAGVTLPCDRVAEFRDRLNAYAAQRLTPDDFCPSIELDAVLSFQELTERSVMEVLGLAPFGFGNHAPVFGVMGAEICGPASPIGEKHLRVPVRHNGRTVFLKAWHFAQRANELQQGRRVDVAICVEEDAYSAARGFPGWCAVLKDVRTAEAAMAANGHITSR